MPLAAADSEVPPPAATAAPPPAEFAAEAVEAASSAERQLFRSFHSTAEPHASLVRQGLTFIKDPDSPTHLNDSPSNYYNTTDSATLEFYADEDLPQPTKQIETCRRDLSQWGFCLVEEAMSEPQRAAMLERVQDQAAGEREAGVGLWLNASATGSNTQFVTTLLNKGECFEGACEFDPAHVQAGPLLEQLLSEALGGDFLLNSFQAIIAHQDNYPQELHQDMNGSSPYKHPEAPLMVTAMYMLDDVGPENGGTLVIPGSHRLVSQAAPGEQIPDLPPPINVTVPRGTVMLFDHRLLHGTGVNRTAEPRHILIAGYHRTWMRTQEAWLLSAAPEVLQRASPRLLQRLGFSAHTIGTIEGHGLGASGAPEDEFSSVVGFRHAMDDESDNGGYHRIGVLSPTRSSEEELCVSHCLHEISLELRFVTAQSAQLGSH
jgi:ectoine hydroxylase-related dioxygenase (phytanoyl-CoA dioxygenase family)